MAEKRRQEEADENSFSKRHCVENVDVVGDLNGEEGPVDQEVVEDPPASWGSQASSSDSSGSSSSGHQAGGDSSSEGSIADSLDLGLGDIQPDTLAGPMGWLQKQMMSGINPRSILMRIIPPGMIIPEEMDEFEMWSIIAEYLRSIDEPPPRQKLEQYNTFDDALQLLRSCKNILVLTGAGVSVSCGIPDFRSRDGVYARLAVDFPDLPDPQAMFEISYFRKDPRPFYKFAKELFPGQFKPSTSHKFISQLEQHQKLLRNYTQNIDTLEQAAGITRVIQCHGSFATATCTRCGLRVDSDAIREDVFNQVVPICPHCGPDTPEMAVLKPDIVFFGEGLPNNFYDKLNDDKEAADLLIVMGSSLKVRPVATIPSLLPKNVPQILINREPLHHLNFDIELLGDCDVIINEILHRLGEGWNHACQSQQRLTETTDIPDIPKPAKEIHEVEKAVMDEGETTEDCKTDAESVVSMSNPERVDVKSEEVLQKSLSELKESGGDDVDDSCKASNRGEGDDRFASSDSKESFILIEGDKNQSCNERHQPQIEEARSEPCINGSTFEGKLHVDVPPSSGNKANDPSSPVSDRLQSSDVKFDSALVSSEPQNSIVTPSESTRSPTVQSANAAESYMHFQRTLDSIGNSSMSFSSSGVKVEKDHTLERDPESCKTPVDSDSKQPSAGVKSESLEISVNEGDRTSLPEDLEDKSSAVVNDGSPEATGDHKTQASPAQGVETKPSPSTSAAARTSRETVATYLKESTFLFIPPMRYVFHGAEVYLSDDESEHGLEGLDKDMDVNDLHNDTEDGDLHRDLHGDLHDDLHDDLHNGDDLPDLLNLDHSSAKEKNVSLDDLTPTVPLTGRESSQYVQPVSRAQYDLESKGREGSPFEAPAHESVYHTNMEQPVTP